jgi:hypothetical protein
VKLALKEYSLLDTLVEERARLFRQREAIDERLIKLRDEILPLITTLKPGDVTTVPTDHWNHRWRGRQVKVTSVAFSGDHYSSRFYPERNRVLAYNVNGYLFKKDGSEGCRHVDWTTHVKLEDLLEEKAA